MKKLLSIIEVLMLLNLLQGITVAQNLVPNPSFEQYDTCPNAESQIYHAIPWFQSTLGTPDYFNECETVEYFLSVPKNFAGFQTAKTGVAYSGLFLYYYDNTYQYREYIEVQLDAPLIANNKYYISFYISLADSSNYTTDDVCIYLSADSIKYATWDTLPVIPQICNQAGNFTADKTLWNFISTSYIANGGERFITIGNFNGDSLTDTVYVGNGWRIPALIRTVYYYIDHVCVSKDSLTCSLINTIIKNKDEDAFQIFPNPVENHFWIYSYKIFDYKIKIYSPFGKEVSYIRKIFGKQSKIVIDNYVDNFLIIEIIYLNNVIHYKLLKL